MSSPFHVDASAYDSEVSEILHRYNGDISEIQARENQIRREFENKGKIYQLLSWPFEMYEKCTTVEKILIFCSFIFLAPILRFPSKWLLDKKFIGSSFIDLKLTAFFLNPIVIKICIVGFVVSTISFVVLKLTKA